MIHLLIVDDEQIIRMGIKNSISWEEHGIEVVGSASDGEEAFQLALRYRPDIVLTDLRMPRMDGIALIKKMKEAGLSAKVIVLTAYNETSYYAEVIPLGIENFVLKNACSDAILDEVLKVAEKIQKERQMHNLTERKTSDRKYVCYPVILHGRRFIWKRTSSWLCCEEAGAEPSAARPAVCDFCHVGQRR